MRTLAHALATPTVSLLTLLALATTGCVQDVGTGSKDGRKPNKGTEDKQDEDGCEQVNTPVTLRTASDLDKLPAGCWDLFAKLRIEGPAITSLAKLGELVAVNELEIVDTGLTTLDVGAAFDVYGAVLISGNTKLTSIERLQPLNADELTTSYTIRNNAALTSLGRLAYLSGVEGELRIADNAKLASISFDELTQAGSIAITNNGATSIDLGSLQQVGRLEISNNAALTTITGAAASTLQGDLIIRGNRALTSIGSWSISTLAGNLTLDDNDALRNLGGLSSLRTVTGSVAVTNHALLDNIDAVSRLQRIGSALLTGNANLSNCRALEVDHCVQHGGVTFNNNKPNTGNCTRCWCE